MRKISINAASVALSVGTTSARAAVSGKPLDYILVDNTFPGAVDCYLRSGDDTVVATTSHMHIAAGEKAVYEIPPEHTHVAGITAAGTGTVRLVRGAGE